MPNTTAICPNSTFVPCMTWPPTFPALIPHEKAALGCACHARIGAGPVPVKDRYRNLGDAKNIVSGRGEHDKNAASAGALRRVSREKRNLLRVADESERRWRLRRRIGHVAVTEEAPIRRLGHAVAQYVAQSWPVGR